MEVMQAVAQFIAELMVAGIVSVVILFIIIAVGGDILRYIEKRRDPGYGQADE